MSCQEKVTEPTLRDTIKPSAQHLRKFITCEYPNKTDEALVKDCVTGIARGLTHSPRLYRCYGPVNYSVYG